MPDFIGVLLMLFSALVFVIAVVGLLRPSLVRIPDRMAAVWAFALSVGLFIGGGMLLSPPNGESTASDTSVERDDMGSRLADIEARTVCNARLTDAATTLFYAGARHRWTVPDAETRFSEKWFTDVPNVTTYMGSALEFMNPDGSWTRTIYECDWNSETARSLMCGRDNRRLECLKNRQTVNVNLIVQL